MKKIFLTGFVLFLASSSHATYTLDAGDLLQLGATADDFREEVRLIIDEANADLFLLRPLSCVIPPDPPENQYKPIMEDAIDLNSDMEEDAVDEVANIAENCEQLFSEHTVELDDFVVDRVGGDHSDPDFTSLYNASAEAVKNAHFGKSGDMLFPVHDLTMTLYKNFVETRLIALYGDAGELRRMFSCILKFRRELGLRCTVDYPCFHMPAWIVDDPPLPGEP